MGKFKNGLYKFMYGRYGRDSLGTALLWTYAALLILHMILSLFIENPWYYVAYFVVSWALVITIFYRMMSRKISKRRRENEKFVGFFKLMKNRFKDRRTHVYRKCPSCRATLRLPKSKGKHTVVCPRCRQRFEVKG